MLIPELWDSLLADSPDLMALVTPWAHLPDRTGVRFDFVRSDHPEFERSALDARGSDGWLRTRDPDGRFLAALDAVHAFEHGVIGLDDTDTILIDLLESQGSTVSLAILPGSSHIELSDRGRQVIIDIFAEIASSDP